MPEVINSVIIAIVLLINSIGAGYVLMQNPKRLVNRTFFALIISISIWGFGLILLSNTAWFELCNLIILYGGLLVVANFVIFSQVFPHGIPPARSFWLLFIPMLILGALVPTNLIISEAVVTNGLIQPVNGPLFSLYALVNAGYILYGLVQFVKTYNFSSLPERRRLKYFFLGCGVFIVTALTVDMILPSMGFFALNILGPISSLAMVVATGYAIVKYNLMDIRIVIQRGLVYTILFTLLAGTYISCILLLGSVLHTSDRYTVFISAGIAVVAGAFGVGPLERYFGKVTDKWFFKNRYNYGESLHRLSQIVNTTVDQGLIIRKSEETLKEIFKAENVAILMGSIYPPRLLSPMDYYAEVCVPLIFEDTRIGFLMVGKKRSGDYYTQEDIRLIQTFSYQAAVALEKAKLFEEVKRYSITLEQLVEERTQTIKQLLEDQKQSMFDISHSLQTPLAVLTNQIESLEHTTVDSRILATCRHSIKNVSQFIRRLLHLVTLESKSGTDTMLPFNLSELVIGEIDYFSTMAEVEHIVFESEVEQDVVIFGNTDLVNELIMNLVTNAIKYSGDKENRFIKLVLFVQSGSAVVQVVDNGIGIPEEYQESVFKRFYRAREKGSVDGNGLGLATCKRIADIHNASIEVTSVFGEGSTFTVRFPQLI